MGSRLLTERAPLLELIAQRVGTPAWVYDADRIRAQYRALDEALTAVPHRLFYSVKANSNLAVLGILRSLGAGVDVVSVGEIERALRAGFAPSDIVFSGVGKGTEELRRAVELSLRSINVESFDELRALEAIASQSGANVACGIRVNPDVKTATHPYTQTGEAGMKFGAPIGDVEPMGQYVRGSAALRLESIGMHIGSQIFDVEHYRRGAETLATVIAGLRAIGVDTLRMVDVGGGLGIPYTSEAPVDLASYAGAVGPLAASTGLALAAEPGRYIVGDAGVLLTRCRYRKRAGTKEFVIVDAAMNDFLRPSLYDARHDIVVVGWEQESAKAAAGVVDVVGPVCETGDFLGLDRHLPGAVPGALLAVRGAGAYGFTMSSTYNSRPRAAEVLVDGERWAIIREREVVGDLWRGERALEEIDDMGAWST